MPDINVESGSNLHYWRSLIKFLREPQTSLGAGLWALLVYGNVLHWNLQPAQFNAELRLGDDLSKPIMIHLYFVQNLQCVPELRKLEAEAWDKYVEEEIFLERKRSWRKFEGSKNITWLLSVGELKADVCIKSNLTKFVRLNKPN